MCGGTEFFTVEVLSQAGPITSVCADCGANNRPPDPVGDAVAAGKVSPARADYWARLYGSDPEGVGDLLGCMAPGVIPVVADPSPDALLLAADGLADPWRATDD
jgi:hypothetical protein